MWWMLAIPRHSRVTFSLHTLSPTLISMCPNTAIIIIIQLKLWHIVWSRYILWSVWLNTFRNGNINIWLSDPVSQLTLTSLLHTHLHISGRKHSCILINIICQTRWNINIKLLSLGITLKLFRTIYHYKLNWNHLCTKMKT